MLTATDRYLARRIAVPLFATLVISAMLLLLDRMLRLFDFVASEGGPVSIVWRMLANLLPEYLALGIPIGLLLGILLAFRGLALSSELDVFRAVGQGYGRLLRVPFMYAIALMAVNLAIVGFLQPLARYYYEELRFDLRSGALGASIKVGEFTKIGNRIALRIEESRAEGTDLRGIFIRAEEKNGQSAAAGPPERGQFLATDDVDTIILRLSNGTLLHSSPKFNQPRILTFTSHDLPIDLPKIDSFRARSQFLERTLPELISAGWDPKVDVKTRNEYQANLHFRVVEVIVMALLPLLAVALAVPPKRSTSALGVFLAIVMVVTYHKINQYGEGIGGLGIVNPAVALWVPCLIFAALVGWMYHVIAHVPGGQPIGWLESAFARFGGILKGLLSLGRRRSHMA
ncbi:MAG: LptF/LptG family permease [Parasphingorhabdus sp.]|nr:LptF/LptG family permease [Parasphingorhabdus sp.]